MEGVPIMYMLKSIPPLNHPYISFAAGIVCIIMGLFVFIKNPRSRLNRLYFVMTFYFLWWFTGNAFSMFYYSSFKTALLWWMIGYTLSPLFGIVSYHFYLVLTNRKSRLLYLLYAASLPEMAYLWLNKSITTGLYFVPNVGGVWNKISPFTYYLGFGMIKFAVLTFTSAILFWVAARKEAQIFKKRQLKFFAILLCILGMGFIEWLPGFGVALHIAWLVLPPFLLVTGYAIIRYRFLEIDTAIHRTLLWILTSGLILIPTGILFYFIHPWLSKFNFIQCTFFVVGFFYAYLCYYKKIQPKIDYLFRRRKYDYHHALGLIASRISTEVQINEIISRLFRELKETLYIRNGLLLVKATGKDDYEEIFNIGYENLDRLGLSQKTKNVFRADSRLSAWFNRNLKAIDRGEVELNPGYEDVREGMELFFKQNALEILVPILLEGKSKGLLALGKKENLLRYTLEDIRILETLGRQLGVILDNALRHGDLVKKELLDRITDGVDEGIMLIDRDYKILWANSRIREFSSGKEISGEHCYQITHKFEGPCSGKGHFCPLDESVKTGLAATVLHTHQGKSGTKMYVEVSTHPLPDYEGRVNEYIHITRDVTKKIELEQSLKENVISLEQAKAELQRKIRELETFNKIAVDRELKMVELKEKIKALEQKLSAKNEKPQ
jgi:PAS domain S-box-containing protein